MPPARRRLAGYLPSLFRRKGFGTRSAALDAAAASKLGHPGIVAALVLILDLPGGDVADELGELERVARALLAGRAHALIMGVGSSRRYPRGDAELIQGRRN